MRDQAVLLLERDLALPGDVVERSLDLAHPARRARNELDHDFGGALGDGAELGANDVGLLGLGDGSDGRLGTRLRGQHALGTTADAASGDGALVEKGSPPVDEHAVDVLLGALAHSTSLQRSMLAARRRLTTLVWVSMADSRRSMSSTLKTRRSWGVELRPFATWLRLRPR